MTTSPTVRHKRRHSKTRRSEKDGACRRCGNPIHTGDVIASSQREFAHPSCVRLRVVARPEGPRYVQGSHVGEACEGCGFPITSEDEVVTVVTVPWHKECRLRR